MPGTITVTQTWLPSGVTDEAVKFHPNGDAIHRDGKTRERILGEFAGPTQAAVFLRDQGQQACRYHLWTPTGIRVGVTWPGPEKQQSALVAALVVLYRAMGLSEADARALASLPRRRG